MSKKNIRIYTPNSSVRNPTLVLRQMWGDIISGRDLAWRLAVRDFQAQHRQSLLGFLWIFIIPLANTITWIFLRQSGVVTLSSTDIPYPVYVFTGTMIWSIFTESVQGPLLKLNTNRSLLTKINFQREALILSSIYQSLGNASVKVLLMLLGMIFLNYNFLGATLWLSPFAIIALVISGTAIGLLLSPVGLLYNDIGKGLPIAMQFLMFLCPVVFAVPKVGWVGDFMNYNPLTPLIVTTRSWITGNTSMFTQGFVEVTIGLFVLFLVGLVIYRITMPILIERMSS